MLILVPNIYSVKRKIRKISWPRNLIYGASLAKDRDKALNYLHISRYAKAKYDNSRILSSLISGWRWQLFHSLIDMQLNRASGRLVLTDVRTSWILCDDYANWNFLTRLIFLLLTIRQIAKILINYVTKSFCDMELLQSYLMRGINMAN